MAGAGLTALLTVLALLTSTEGGVRKRDVDVSELVSPCPDVFSYDAEQKVSNAWYGTLLIRPESPANSMRLDITMDRPANLLGNWDGEVKTRNNVNFTILNQQRRLIVGPTVTVRMFATYSEGQTPPQIVTIKLNHVEICPGSREEELANGKCGVVDPQARPLVTKGQDTQRGQWPWHAALYTYEGASLSYICGGSLVSRRSIVTAAHCVTSPVSGRPVDPENLVVYLGKYKRKMWSEGGVQDKQVMKVEVHPMYNASSYYGDIAVLTLANPADYSNYVKPVCLWDSSLTDLSYVEERVGTVVGWGFDETGKVTEELKLAVLPVVTQLTCLRSFPTFFSKFTSEQTYCAGYRNGTSVCNGDSGGGMVFSDRLPNGGLRWSLRGVVSVSVARRVESGNVCDTNHYIVFTDVAKYLDFVNGAVVR